jgi:hypothetical protein
VEVARAQPLDFLEVVDADGRPTVRNRRAFGLYARQIAVSEALTWRDAAGELVAIVGLYHDAGRGWWEGWLAAGPALRAQLRPLLKDLQQDLAALAPLLNPGEIVAYIAPESVAGGRMAKLLGFQPCDPTASPLGPLDTYRRSLT